MWLLFLEPGGRGVGEVPSTALVAYWTVIALWNMLNFVSISFIELYCHTHTEMGVIFFVSKYIQIIFMQISFTFSEKKKIKK